MPSQHPPTPKPTRAPTPDIGTGGAHAGAAVALAGALVVVALMGASTAHAELVAVDQPASGMECPECSRGLRMAVGVLDGVDKLETSWNRRLLTAHFRVGSRATLEEIRRIIRVRHFVPLEAQVIVRGLVSPVAQGAPASAPQPRNLEVHEVRVSGSGACYQLKTASDQIGAQLQAARGHTVVIRGRVPAPVAGAAAQDPLLILVDGVVTDPLPEQKAATPRPSPSPAH